MVRITPVEIKSKEDCLNLVRPSAYYRTLPTLDKIKYLRQEFPIRLEKVNELVWKNYPTHKISKLQEIAIRFDTLADRTMNTELKNDFNSMKELINNLLFFFKNYQEMVAYTTLLYYETDTLVNEDNIELLQLKERFNILEQESFALKDKLRVFDFLIIQTELLTNQLKIAQQEIHKYQKNGDFDKKNDKIGTILPGVKDMSSEQPPRQSSISSYEGLDIGQLDSRPIFQLDKKLDKKPKSKKKTPRQNLTKPTGMSGQLFELISNSPKGKTVPELIELLMPKGTAKEKKTLRSHCDNMTKDGLLKKHAEEDRGTVYSAIIKFEE